MHTACVVLLGRDEDLGDGVPPVVRALAEVSEPVEAAVHVDEALPGGALHVSAIGMAPGAGDGGAELVVFLGPCPSARGRERGGEKGGGEWEVGRVGASVTRERRGQS